MSAKTIRLKVVVWLCGDETMNSLGIALAIMVVVFIWTLMILPMLVDTCQRIVFSFDGVRGAPCRSEEQHIVLVIDPCGDHRLGITSIQGSGRASGSRSGCLGWWGRVG